MNPIHLATPIKIGTTTDWITRRTTPWTPVLALAIVGLLTACSSQQSTPPATPSTVTTPTQTVKDKVRTAEDALKKRETMNPTESPNHQESPSSP
ncbi:MAG: hypothetical protein NZ772_08475 [Cyanobacteria bacterium]|nr:hypothetical protein [Cyanobacteriota bacterium]MDW8201512.1 hypothetical protein [Cyanobacteriota bacterium SKYGB_h_bin112]